MTKMQLKNKYMEWNKEISSLAARKIEIFHEMQELCYEKGDGHKWCGIEPLVEALVRKGHIMGVMRLVSEYYEISGKEEALREFAIATNNFEI